MQQYPSTSAARFIPLGIYDSSLKEVRLEKTQLPQHLPLVFTYAGRHTSEAKPMSSASATLAYGVDTFDTDSKYATHQTEYIKMFRSNANICRYKRIIPTDAKKANKRIYLDIIATTVPNYVRNSEGQIKIDPVTGAKVVDSNTPTVDGHRYKFISETYPTGIDVSAGVSKTGTMTIGNDTSTMYPIIDLEASAEGNYYNNIGFILKSILRADIDMDVVSNLDYMLYGLAKVSREDINSSYDIVPTLFKEKYPSVCFKSGAKNYKIAQNIDIGFKMEKEWSNTTNPDIRLLYPDIGEHHIYNDNLSKILTDIMRKEKLLVNDTMVTWSDNKINSTDQWFDYDLERDLLEQSNVINPFTGKSTLNVPYLTIQQDESIEHLTPTQKVIRLTNDTPLFLEGGTDGTMSNDLFGQLVAKYMEKYLDPDDDVQSIPMNVESIIYDTGFELKHKYSLINFIANRKDVVVAFSTSDYTMGNKARSLSEDRAISLALYSRLKQYPESELYGTVVSRAIIAGTSGVIGDSKKRISLLYSVGSKASKHMGAGDGNFKEIHRMTGTPNSIVTELNDIEPRVIPDGIKDALHNASMIYSEPSDTESNFIPQYSTVYDNDTSVLKSFPLMIAICTLTKLASMMHIRYAGREDLSQAQLAEKIENDIREETDAIFNGVYIIKPVVEFTATDKTRGWVYHLTNEIYAYTGKFVQIYKTQAFARTKE